MKPIDYSERVLYRPPPRFYSRMQWLGVLLTSSGLAPDGAATLEVKGRRSGRTRRTPVLLIKHDGAEHLVALAGESQWVRNVRAAAGIAELRRRKRRRVRLVELGIEDRSPVIAAYIQRHGAGREEALHYFGLGPDPSSREVDAIARFYPVFRIEPAH